MLTNPIRKIRLWTTVRQVKRGNPYLSRVLSVGILFSPQWIFAMMEGERNSFNPRIANQPGGNMKRKLFAGSIMLLLVICAVGCGAAPTPVSTPTASPIPPTPTASLPSYADIVATYPEGTTLSCTDAELASYTDDGDYSFTNGLVCPGQSQVTVAEGGTFTLEGTFWITYGVKATLLNEVTIDGVTFPAGAKLTVDKDLKWVQVSGW